MPLASRSGAPSCSSHRRRPRRRRTVPTLPGASGRGPLGLPSGYGRQRGALVPHTVEASVSAWSARQGAESSSPTRRRQGSRGAGPLRGAAAGKHRDSSPPPPPGPRTPARQPLRRMGQHLLTRPRTRRHLRLHHRKQRHRERHGRHREQPGQRHDERDAIPRCRRVRFFCTAHLYGRRGAFTGLCKALDGVSCYAPLKVPRRHVGPEPQVRHLDAGLAGRPRRRANRPDRFPRHGRRFRLQANRDPHLADAIEVGVEAIGRHTAPWTIAQHRRRQLHQGAVRGGQHREAPQAIPIHQAVLGAWRRPRLVGRKRLAEIANSSENHIVRHGHVG